MDPTLGQFGPNLHNKGQTENQIDAKKTQIIFIWYARIFTFVGGPEWIQHKDLSGSNPGTILPKSAQQRATRKPKNISEIDAKKHEICKNIYIFGRTEVDPA